MDSLRHNYFPACASFGYPSSIKDTSGSGVSFDRAGLWPAFGCVKWRLTQIDPAEQMRHRGMDLNLNYTQIGEGYPVLFIHGWEMDGRVEQLDFEPIFSQQTGFQRIYVDLPGMGNTPAKKDVESLDDIYRQLVLFVASSHLIRSPFAIVGSSCGASLARALAQQFSEQVGGLLLRVPLVEPRDELRDLDPFKPVVTDEQVMSSLSTEDRRLLGNVLVQTPAYVKLLKEKFHKAYVPAMEAANSKVCGEIRADPQKYSLSVRSNVELAKFFAPTLVICGRHDDVVGYRDSLRLLEYYPRSTFAILDRGTHGIPVDERDVFDTLVRDWLSRMTEWRMKGRK